MIQLTYTLEDLEEYFENDEIYSIDYDDESGKFNVAMYSKTFREAFNGWAKKEKGNQYMLYKEINNTVYICYVPVADYEEYVEGVEF